MHAVSQKDRRTMKGVGSEDMVGVGRTASVGGTAGCWNGTLRFEKVKLSNFYCRLAVS